MLGVTSSVSKLLASSSIRRSKRKGFSLIEAVAAVALVGIGVASAMGGLAAMAKTDRQLVEREAMQKLAVQKYDEIISTGQIDTAELSGDFSEQNNDDYEWSATVEPSGEENLEILSVTVTKVGDPDGPQSSVDGMLFRPPIQGGAPQ